MKLHMGPTKMNKSSPPRNAQNAQIDLYSFGLSKIVAFNPIGDSTPWWLSVTWKTSSQIWLSNVDNRKDLKPASTMDITWYNGISNGKLTFQTQTFFK
jgi:hypothetical protein